MALEKKGDAAGAEAAYRRAVEHGPQLPEARNNLGGLLLARGDSAGAEREFSAATRANPGYADAYFNLGVLYDQAGRHAEAVAAYRQAVRVKPAEVSYRLNLGAALRRSGDLEGALVEVAPGDRAGADQRPGLGQPRAAPVGRREPRRCPGGAGQGDQARSGLRGGLGRAWGGSSCGASNRRRPCRP